MTQNERRIFLIDYLVKENGAAVTVPPDISEQKRLLRSLMNVRAPKPVPEEFLKIQDAYLREEIADRGITDCSELPFVRDKMSLWQGDITTLRCGAIVNAANSALLGCFVPCHGCIDNAIHTYAGIELRAECDKIMRGQGHAEKTGASKITKAYNLPCDYVIHTVGPVVCGHLTENERCLLASCYLSCLKAAEKHGIASIAFCCISTGEFGFPNAEAARIAVETVTEYLKNSDIERVIFNVFKNTDKEIYEKLLG